MKKFLVVLLILSLTTLGYAFDKSKVKVGAEYGLLEQELDSVTESVVISNGVDSITGALEIGIDEVELQQGLVTIGYTISDYLMPYVILGTTNLSFDKTINGSISILGSTSLISYEYEAIGFTYGVGATGLISALPFETSLTYDLRYLMASSDDDVIGNVLPAFTSLQYGTTAEVDYSQLSLLLALSRTFEIDKVVNSITPMIGYKISRVDMNIKDTLNVDTFSPINVALNTETNLENIMQSAVVGVSVKVNDRLSAGVNGMFGDESGVIAGVSYKF